MKNNYDIPHGPTVQLSLLNIPPNLNHFLQLKFSIIVLFIFFSLLLFFFSIKRWNMSWLDDEMIAEQIWLLNS